MFSTWSLKKKLLSSYALATFFMMIVGGLFFYQVGEIIEDFSHVTDVNFENSAHTFDIRGTNYKISTAVAKIEDQVAAEEVENYTKRIEDDIQKIMAASAEYEKIPFAEGEEEIWKKFVTNRDSMIAALNAFVKLKRASADQAKIDFVVGEYWKAHGELREDLNAIIAFHTKESKHWKEHAKGEGAFGIMLAILCVAIGSLATGILGFSISSSLSRLLGSIAESLTGGAQEVASAASQISATSEELSSSTTEQAAALQETAASVEEMSAMIKKSSDNSAHSKKLADSSAAAAHRGQQVVTEMIEAIKAIDESNRDIAEVVKVIADIDQKTKVINDIVFKTQLLSFNASVEAARAGEHGKGFAVVAEEVGNLAQLSGSAAGEISKLLEDSVAKVQKLIETNQSKVEIGLSVSQRCEKVLEEIVTDIQGVNTMSGEIATATNEQSRGVAEITKAMTQLDQVTQQNATASQQAASAAESLSGQAELLRNSVDILRHTVQGGNMATSHGGNAPATRSTSSKAKLQAVPLRADRSSVPSGDAAGFSESA
ncbi:MAG TPA: methyl-accepting chemotaxis protein [Bdellovibrionales bacterium]|nr:methyl-accepting chemotaxis protein [Bdellovibrionales bacterium]